MTVLSSKYVRCCRACGYPCRDQAIHRGRPEKLCEACRADPTRRDEAVDRANRDMIVEHLHTILGWSTSKIARVMGLRYHLVRLSFQRLGFSKTKGK